MRVDDQQGQAGRVEVAGDGLDGEVAGVEEGQVVGLRAQDRGLVEQAGRGADVVVLGALDEQGELLAGHLRAGEAEQGQRDGALQGVAGGQAAAAGHVAGDHQVGPGQRSAEPLAEHPGDARDVRRPAGDVARLRVGGEVRGLQVAGRGGDAPVGARGGGPPWSVAAARRAARTRRCSRCGRR